MSNNRTKSKSVTDSLSGLDIYDPKFNTDPFTLYEKLHLNEPIIYLKNSESWLVTSADIITEICSQPDLFSNDISVLLAGLHSEKPKVRKILEEGLPQVPVLLMSDPPDHSRFRRLVGMAFSGPRINNIESEIRKISRNILDNLKFETSWDFISEYAIPMPVNVIGGQLGLCQNDINKIRSWSDAFTDRLSGMIDEKREEACAYAVVDFQKTMQHQITLRRNHKYDDLLGDLVAASSDGDKPLSNAEIVSVIQQIMVAGNETSTSAMAEGIKLLIENPSQMKLLRQDNSLLKNTVEEILRLASPVAGSWRIATRDVTISGKNIKNGDKIMLRFAAGSRDSEKFNQPNEMDINRQNSKTHYAFGRGIHTCVGNMLARREISICLEHMINMFETIELTNSDEEHKYSPNVMLRGLKVLNIQTKIKN
ncbi:cytochrome P450 [Hellea sp.]|nr:cytochrome P450 [Hellea sp.]MBT7399203.1 cytochrome P450 [Hellea sp.]MDA8888470.1 cytochrome P450 [Hellea sp.]MDB4844811.1 cytochrome P450 [Hellea sp.]MDC1062713.1 cytochrome P450 [Hellea sp.]MDC1088976.1 cytochrome P450 [Hellea sp.]